MEVLGQKVETLNIEKYLHVALSTQTIGLNICFLVMKHLMLPAIQNTSEEYNGSSWTSGGDMNIARRNVVNNRNTNSSSC